jgi:ribulose-phosphate 3-epimerase
VTAAARRSIRGVSWEVAREIEVEPSLYAADFAHLGEQVEALLDAGVRVFHFDVGDGHFVEPVTMGPVVLRAIAPLVRERGGLLDCHLMVAEPERHIHQFAAAGADSVTFHVEAAAEPARLAEVARAHGCAAGLALNPDTSVDDVARHAEAFDLVLCMSVHPGYSGQAFIPESVERVHRLRELVPAGVRIQVDGGVGPDNVQPLRQAGATLLVAATAIFGDPDPPAAYRRLVAAVA